MPWETSDRHSELPEGWRHKIQPAIIERDQGRCQWPRAGRRGGICGQLARDVDHKHDPHDHSPGNLWALCRWHHTMKTQQESAAARRAIQDKTRHPVERHPGLS